MGGNASKTRPAGAKLRLYSQAYATVALLSAAFFVLQPIPSFAEDEEVKFYASQFTETPFIDEEIDKHDFRDLAKRDASEERAVIRGDKKWSEKAAPMERESHEVANERSSFEQEKKFAPVHELAGDWVPSPIDVKNNGMFSDYPFNGSPVPYDLNGHVNLESGGALSQFHFGGGSE